MSPNFCIAVALTLTLTARAESDFNRDVRPILNKHCTGCHGGVKHKLSAQRPETLAQASRMPGITPAAISLLWVHLKRRSRGDGPANRHPAARSA